MKREILLVLAMLVIVMANGQNSNTISFQGSLTTPGTNNPIPDGPYSMVFTLYDSTGTDVWTETQAAVPVTNGFISVELGSVTPLDVSKFYLPLELEITIGGETLSPRISLTTVPFAQTAKALVSGDSLVFKLANQKAGIVDQTNTALGFYSFVSEQGSGFFNQAFGTGSLAANNGGSQNVAIGSYALASNTTGGTNIALGYNALNLNTISSDNIAVGSFALENNTDGTENIGVGRDALINNTTGRDNTAVGSRAMAGIGAGIGNTAIGSGALSSNGGDGSYNVTVGYDAMINNKSNNNTGVGTYALISNTTGNNNTAIGFAADVSAGDLTNATAIGSGAIVSQSNSMVLGDGTVNVGIGTSAPSEKLEVAGTIKADTFAYSNPQIRYYAIPPNDYEVAGNNASIYKLTPSNGIYSAVAGGTGTSSAMIAPINLPDGAIITGFKAGIYDGDVTNDVSLEIRRQAMASISTPATVTGTLVVSTGNPGFAELEVTDLSIVIDNEFFAYTIRFNTMDNNPSNLVIYVTRITYIVPGP